MLRRMDVLCFSVLRCARLCTTRKIFLRARPADAFSHNKERSEWPLRNDGIVSVIVAQLCGQTSAFNWQFTRLALRPARPPLSLRAERAATDLADAAQTKTIEKAEVCYNLEIIKELDEL
jgi:hypothetical protein